MALKLLPDASGDEERKQRFFREARSAAAITHPNVAVVHQVGEADGRIYIAMELVEGENLRARLARERLDVAEALGLAVQIARGLSAAHEKGIVHRDLKPENVMLTPAGQVKILDFGLAKTGADRRSSGDTEAALAKTETLVTSDEGRVMGTPQYMSPEQALGETVDVRSDVFSFGIVLYEMLAGERPFGGESAGAVLVAIARDAAPPVRTRVPEVDQVTEAVIMRCLAKPPGERFPSAGEVVTALAKRVETGMTESRTQVAPLIATWPVRGRRRWGAAWVGIPAWAVAGGVAVAIAASGLLAAKSRRAASEVGSATSGPSSTAPRAILFSDLPAPATSVSEALTYYQRAMRDSHDAVLKSQSELRQAVALDPSFAAAQLRLALVMGMPRGRVVFQEAVRLKDNLDDRDQAILDAEAPLILDAAPDTAEAERRMMALHVARPRDVEVLELLGSIQRRIHVADAHRTFEDLLALDPTAASAELGLAALADREGNWDEAFAHDDRCTRISPAATACILDAAGLRARRGQCAESAEALRRALVLDGDDYFTLKAQLAALLAGSASLDEVEALVERALASPMVRASPPSVRRSASGLLRAAPALWFGSMLAAGGLMEDAYDATAGAGSQGDTFFAERLAVAEEVGDEARARALTQAYAASRASQLAGALDGVALRALREHDGRSAEAVAALRDRWIGNGADPGTLGDWKTWVTYYATPPTTRAEAEASLQRRAEFTAVPEFPSARDSGAVGHVLLLAGKADEAIRWLELAAHSCQPIVRETSNSYIPAILHAAYELGLAREAVGDKGAACGAYQQVIDRWGKAAPRSTLAEEARRRMRSLPCGP